MAMLSNVPTIPTSPIANSASVAMSQPSSSAGQSPLVTRATSMTLSTAMISPGTIDETIASLISETEGMRRDRSHAAVAASKADTPMKVRKNSSAMSGNA